MGKVSLETLKLQKLTIHCNKPQSHRERGNKGREIFESGKTKMCQGLEMA